MYVVGGPYRAQSAGGEPGGPRGTIASVADVESEAFGQPPPDGVPYRSRRHQHAAGEHGGPRPRCVAEQHSGLV